MNLFKKIIDREIPADIVYEDDRCLAFRDINPQAPTHILIIPKKEIESMEKAQPEDQDILGYLLLKAKDIAEQEGISKEGFRLVINTNANAGQAVYHLHVHLLGGRPMNWPPG